MPIDCLFFRQRILTRMNAAQATMNDWNAIYKVRTTTLALLVCMVSVYGECVW